MVALCVYVNCRPINTDCKNYIFLHKQIYIKTRLISAQSLSTSQDNARKTNKRLETRTRVKFKKSILLNTTAS